MIDESDQASASVARFFTIAEIARQFGVSEKWVRRRIAEGQLPVHQMGRLIRISEADAAAYIKKSRITNISG
jgi:excisionase family DNA binding protein